MTDTSPKSVLPHRIAKLQGRLRSQLVPWMCRWFIEEFGMLRINVTLMGGLIEERRLQYSLKFGNAIAAMDADEAASYTDVLVDEKAFIEMLPQLQWRSQYLMIYAAFEHALNRICAVARQRLKLHEDKKRKNHLCLNGLGPA